MSAERGVMTFRNPHVTSVPAEQLPAREILAFHRRLPGYAPTRLVHAPTLARMLDVRDVWVKDDGQTFAMLSRLPGAPWQLSRCFDRTDMPARL